MALNNCIAGTTIPVVTPGTTPSTPGTVVLTPDGPAVAVPVAGLLGANFIARDDSSSFPAMVLPSAPQGGNIVIAMGIGYPFSPAVNTGAGWNQVAAADHDPHVLDPGTRLAWKYFATGGSQVQQPFVGGGPDRHATAIWEVHGLDPSFTPNLHSVTISSPGSGASTILLTDAVPTQGLYLFAAFGTPNSGDPGIGTLGTAGWTVDGTDHGNGAGGLAAHIAFTSTPGSAVDQSLTMGFGMPMAGIMVGLNLGTVDASGTSGGTTTVYQRIGAFTTVKLNGATVSTDAVSLNVVGDVTLTDDGAGNLTLTIPPGLGPHVDMVASETIADGAQVSFWNSSGGKVRNADDADDTKQVDGFVLTGGVLGDTLRVYLPGAVNSAVSGLTPGAIYFLDGTGGLTATPPTTAGKWLQEVGKAADATHLAFNPKTGTLLA